MEFERVDVFELAEDPLSFKKGDDHLRYRLASRRLRSYALLIETAELSIVLNLGRQVLIPALR